MNDRLKALQSSAARVVANPLLPHDARATIADAVYIIGELVRRIEVLEARKESDER